MQGRRGQGREWGSIWGWEEELLSEALCLMLYLYEAFVARFWSQDMGGFEHQMSSQAHDLLSGAPPRPP